MTGVQHFEEITYLNETLTENTTYCDDIYMSNDSQFSNESTNVSAVQLVDLRQNIFDVDYSSSVTNRLLVHNEPYFNSSSYYVDNFYNSNNNAMTSSPENNTNNADFVHAANLPNVNLEEMPVTKFKIAMDVPTAALLSNIEPNSNNRVRLNISLTKNANFRTVMEINNTNISTQYMRQQEQQRQQEEETRKRKLLLQQQLQRQQEELYRSRLLQQQQQQQQQQQHHHQQQQQQQHQQQQLLHPQWSHLVPLHYDQQLRQPHVTQYSSRMGEMMNKLHTFEQQIQELKSAVTQNQRPASSLTVINESVLDLDTKTEFCTTSPVLLSQPACTSVRNTLSSKNIAVSTADANETNAHNIIDNDSGVLEQSAIDEHECEEEEDSNNYGDDDHSNTFDDIIADGDTNQLVLCSEEQFVVDEHTSSNTDPPTTTMKTNTTMAINEIDSNAVNFPAMSPFVFPPKSSFKPNYSPVTAVADDGNNVSESVRSPYILPYKDILIPAIPATITAIGTAITANTTTAITTTTTTTALITTTAATVAIAATSVITTTAAEVTTTTTTASIPTTTAAVATTTSSLSLSFSLLTSSSSSSSSPVSSPVIATTISTTAMSLKASSIVSVADIPVPAMVTTSSSSMSEVTCSSATANALRKSRDGDNRVAIPTETSKLYLHLTKKRPHSTDTDHNSKAKRRHKDFSLLSVRNDLSDRSQPIRNMSISVMPIFDNLIKKCSVCRNSTSNILNFEDSTVIENWSGFEKCIYALKSISPTVSSKLQLKPFGTDEVCQVYSDMTGEQLPCRNIFQTHNGLVAKVTVMGVTVLLDRNCNEKVPVPATSPHRIDPNVCSNVCLPKCKIIFPSKRHVGSVSNSKAKGDMYYAFFSLDDDFYIHINILALMLKSRLYSYQLRFVPCPELEKHSYITIRVRKSVGNKISYLLLPKDYFMFIRPASPCLFMLSQLRLRTNFKVFNVVSSTLLIKEDYEQTNKRHRIPCDNDEPLHHPLTTN